MQTLERTRRPDRSRFREPTDRRTRLFWALALVLLLLHVVLAWSARAPGVSTAQDDSIYLMLARALRAGGYYDLYVVGHPTHNLYPPGYPGLLALLGGMVGERFALLQAFGIAVSTAALGIFAATVRRLWSGRVALLGLAAMVANPHLVALAGKIGSDAPYLLLSMLVLWLLARRDPSPRVLVLATVTAAAAALTRSVGVTLLAALGAHWILERRYVASLAFATACAATVGTWLLWTILAPEKLVGRSYIADATFVPDAAGGSSIAWVLADRALTNLPKYFALFLPNRIGIPSLPGPAALDLLVAAGVGVATLVGLLGLWRRWPVAALYLLLYGALLTFWAWSLGRFLNVVIPLLVLAMLLGIRTVAERVRPRWGWRAMAAAALVLVLFGGVRSAKLIREMSVCRWGTELPSTECRTGDMGAFFNALDYVNRTLPQDAVLLTGKPAPAYYFTGRQTIPLGRAIAAPSEGFLEVLRQHGTDYVLLGRLHVHEHFSLAELLEANCRELSLEAVFQPHTLLMRVLEPGTTAPDGAACDALAAYRELPFRAHEGAEP